MTKRNCNLKPSVKQGRPAITAEKFIEKARAVHGYKFDYPNVCYINNKTKVEIECSTHKTFLQSPAAHLSGQGCPHCAKLITAKKVTTEQFIADAEKVHGKGRYDYSNVVYSGNKVKVEIGCNYCGEAFYQKPNAHVSAKMGCRTCKYKDATVTQAEFVRRSELVHGKGRYSYDKAVYVKGSLKVNIFCNRCNEYFLQAAGNHMAGQSCAQCYFADKRLTQAEFLERCYEKHGFGRFDYSNADYHDSHLEVDIKCNDCGTDFKQSPTNHLKSAGCAICSSETKGFDRRSFELRCKVNNNGNGRLYVIKACDNGNVFYKVGITSHNKLSVRFKGWKAMPYIYQVLHEVDGQPDYIYNLEKQLHRLLSRCNYKPSLDFHGQTECFTTIKPIEQLLKKLSSTEQLQLIA